MLVAITIQPSILRTATAFCDVRASEDEFFFVSVGDEEPFSAVVSTSIFSVEASAMACVDANAIVTTYIYPDSRALRKSEVEEWSEITLPRTA
jgi:hypothetical protein